MGKEIVAITILGFWLILPAACIAFGVTGYNVYTLDTSGFAGWLSTIPVIGGFLAGATNFSTTTFNIMLLYINVLTAHIPLIDSIPYLSWVINILQVASMIIVYLLLRGD